LPSQKSALTLNFQLFNGKIETLENLQLSDAYFSDQQISYQTALNYEENYTFYH